MKKLIGSLILTLTVILGLSLRVPGLADTTTQQTTVGITFTDDATTGGQHDQATTPKQGSASATTTANRTIPNGKQPLTQTGQAADQKSAEATATTTAAKRRHPATLKAAAADLLAGRLPQTSDVQTVLINLIGILLLIVVILSLIIRRQARLLRERE